MDIKEMKGLKEWINKRPNEIGGQDLQKIWDASSSYKEEYTTDVDKGWSTFQSHMNNEPKVVQMRPSFSILKMAAAVALLLVAGLFVKSFLSAGPSLEKIATLDAQRKILDLSDGTLVTLNSKSEVFFPEEFAASERKVILSGEAFFEVARDETKPFLIETGNAEIKVLGTSFNVKSYTGSDSFEVYVKSGKVAVRILDDNQEHILSAGEHLKFDSKNKKTEIAEGQPASPLAWKNAKLKFKSQSMGSILSALGSHYGVNFKSTDPKLDNCPFTINLDSQKLTDALRSLEEACELEFEENGSKKYVVRGNCCK